jgi:hypothetical protein
VSWLYTRVSFSLHHMVFWACVMPSSHWLLCKGEKLQGAMGPYLGRGLDWFCGAQEGGNLGFSIRQTARRVSTLLPPPELGFPASQFPCCAVGLMRNPTSVLSWVSKMTTVIPVMTHIGSFMTTVQFCASSHAKPLSEEVKGSRVAGHS